MESNNSRVYIPPTDNEGPMYGDTGVTIDPYSVDKLGLVQIDNIALTDVEVGTSINDRLSSINSNFQKIVTSEYLKGRDGASIASIECIVDINSDRSYDIIYPINKIAVTSKNLAQKMKSALRANYNLDANDEWLNKLFKTPTSITFITEEREDGTRAIKSSLAYNFVDPDLIEQFKNLNNESYDSANFIDKSCLIYFSGYDNDAHIQQSVPTIYYDSNISDFCWKLNGEKTGIAARGVPGKRGEPGTSFMVGYFECTDKSATGFHKSNGLIKEIYIVGDNENGTPVGKWVSIYHNYGEGGAKAVQGAAAEGPPTDNEGPAYGPVYSYDTNTLDTAAMKELQTVYNFADNTPVLAIGKNTVTNELKLYLGALKIVNNTAKNQSDYYIYYGDSDHKNDISSILARADLFAALSDSTDLFIPICDEQGAPLVLNPSVLESNYHIAHFLRQRSGVDNKYGLSIGAYVYSKANSSDSPGVGPQIEFINDITSEDQTILDEHNSLLVDYSSVDINGDTTITSNLTVAGNTELNTLGVSGESSFAKLVQLSEDLKVDGSITANDITLTGATGNNSIVANKDIWVGGTLHVNTIGHNRNAAAVAAGNGIDINGIVKFNHVPTDEMIENLFD